MDGVVHWIASSRFSTLSEYVPSAMQLRNSSYKSGSAFYCSLIVNFFFYTGQWNVGRSGSMPSLNFKHHLFLFVLLISAITTRRASSGWLLLCDLSPGENTPRADQSPYCNEVSCLPSWIRSLKQSPSQAWSRSTYPRRSTQKWEISSYYHKPWDL